MVLWDGASYHDSEETRETLSELAVPILYFGPYSYLIAPIELFFGLLKSQDLNPDQQKTGKK